MDNYRLEDRVVLVTGGASGLGAAIGQAMGQLGAKVVLGDLNIEKAEETSAELNGAGIATIAVKMDVTDEESIKAALERGVKAFGKVDILVNNAGLTKIQDIPDITTKDWNQVFDINVTGPFLTSKHFANLLSQTKTPGNIVNIASNAAKVTFPGQSHYNATKAAIVNMTQSFAKELAPLNINVNAVCPGSIDTDMLRYCMEKSIESMPQGEKASIEDLRETWGPEQIGRLIQPIEVARVVAFLASDAAYIIRGQSISIDAGDTPY